MKNIFILLMSCMALGACKKDDDPGEAVNDKTALIIGTWRLSETTDPNGAPTELLYLFEADGKFSSRKTLPSQARAETIVEGTWKFANEAQTKVEIDVTGPVVYDIDELSEGTLKLTGDGVTVTFNKV